MANMDTIVNHLNKETNLRNGIINTAKKRKRNKTHNRNSKEMSATPADSAENMHAHVQELFQENQL